MKKSWIGWGIAGVGVSMALGGAALAGCSSSDNVSLPEGEAGVDGAKAETSTSETGADTGPMDGGSAEAAPAADAQSPSRLLLSFNGSSQSEVVAFNLQSGTVDGFLTYAGDIGTTAVTASSPWALEQGNDVVAQLNPKKPWQVQSSWNVALSDYAADAGYSSSYSDPMSVLAAGNKTYVLRYTRNEIAVFDSSQVVDGGAPSSAIDLSSQLQAGGDGYVEMTAGYYDATTKRLYVLLGNIDRYDVAADGYTQLCSTTAPTLVAIDTTTDTLVNLNAGSDAGTMGWTLPGYDPYGQGAMVYDPPNNRLLVLQSGCNTAETDGGVGPVVRREIDAISLATGAAQQLVDLTSAPFPTALYYVDAQHVIVQLDTAYPWNPSSTTLGAAIPNAPEAFSVDGNGNLVGITQPFEPDGGTGPWTVVSVNAADGGVTTLGVNPFPADDAGGVGAGFLGGAQLWPAP